MLDYSEIQGTCWETLEKRSKMNVGPSINTIPTEQIDAIFTIKERKKKKKKGRGKGRGKGKGRQKGNSRKKNKVSFFSTSPVFLNIHEFLNFFFHHIDKKVKLTHRLNFWIPNEHFNSILP